LCLKGHAFLCERNLRQLPLFFAVILGESAQWFSPEKPGFQILQRLPQLMPNDGELLPDVPYTNSIPKCMTFPLQSEGWQSLHFSLPLNNPASRITFPKPFYPAPRNPRPSAPMFRDRAAGTVFAAMERPGWRQRLRLFHRYIQT